MNFIYRLWALLNSFFIKDKGSYWDSVYKRASSEQLPWFKEDHTSTLERIQKLNLARDSKIIDVGGGESTLLLKLHEKGFHHLTSIDLSKVATENLKKMLSSLECHILTGDVLETDFDEKFHLWHDRAVFHFLTNPRDIEAYVKKAYDSLEKEGFLILSTFSENGPPQCSLLPTTRYSKEKLAMTFRRGFELLETEVEEHRTPEGIVQQFRVFILRRKEHFS